MGKYVNFNGSEQNERCLPDHYCHSEAALCEHVKNVKE